MDKVLAFAAVIVGLVVVNLAANAIAQRIFPTYDGDDPERRFAYRIVFLISFAALVGLIIGGVILLDPR